MLIQGAKDPPWEASCPHPNLSVFTYPPPASVSTAAWESLCLSAMNTAQSTLCPAASQEPGTSPKGTLPYWDTEEAQVLRLYLCWLI